MCQRLKELLRHHGALLRKLASALLLTAACGVLIYWMGNFHKLSDWLVWRYIGYWVAGTVFLVSCLGSGLRLLRLVDRGPIREDERISLGLALGCWLFGFLVFVVGVSGALGGVTFFLLPLALLAVGARDLQSLFQRRKRAIARLGHWMLTPRDPLELFALIGLVVGIVILYLPVCSPINIGGDAHWYHLPIAEHYAASGTIRPFKEHWYLGAYSQLASLLYTWAFCLPFGELADRGLLSAHLEFFLFVATFPGISALIRRVSGNGRFPYSGAVLFLFPGIFIYDSGLICGADHVLAFFTPALALAGFRLWRYVTVGSATVLALILSGTALTKPQGSYFVLVFAVFGLVFLLKTRRLKPSLVLVAVTLAGTSVHWLKNWVWYGDPFYPLLHKYLPSQIYPGATELFEHGLLFNGFRFQGPTSELIRELAITSADFAFVPHNWAGFHGELPVFGFLYTLFLPLLFFQKRPARALSIALGVQIAIVAWFLTFQLDRYLQALVPWMTVVIVVTMARLWALGKLIRFMIFLLTGLQLLWTLPLPFYGKHAMMGRNPLHEFIDFAARINEPPEKRLRIAGTLQNVEAALPQNAVVLMHEVQERLGLARPTIADRLRWQGRINYAREGTLRRAAEIVKSLKATHVLWIDAPDLLLRDGYANEAVFADLMLRMAGPAEKHDMYWVAPLKQIPLEQIPDRPLFIGVASCTENLPSGVYIQEDLASGRAPLRPWTSEERVDVQLRQRGCKTLPKIPRRKNFVKFSVYREQWEIWRRKTPLD